MQGETSSKSDDEYEGLRNQPTDFLEIEQLAISDPLAACWRKRDPDGSRRRVAACPFAGPS
jgi:hypothetical protein